MADAKLCFLYCKQLDHVVTRPAARHRNVENYYLRTGHPCWRRATPVALESIQDARERIRVDEEPLERRRSGQEIEQRSRSASKERRAVAQNDVQLAEVGPWVRGAAAPFPSPRFPR